MRKREREMRKRERLERERLERERMRMRTRKRERQLERNLFDDLLMHSMSQDSFSLLKTPSRFHLLRLESLRRRSSLFTVRRFEK
jgi:hypothetical protein